MESSGIGNRLLLVAAAVLFSTGGAAIKAATLTSWQVAEFRSGIAAVALAVFIPAARRNWSRRLVPPAAAYAATLVLFPLATKLTTAANAIFLQSTAPLYLLLLGPLLLHERIRRSDLLFVLGVACGMALLFAGTEPAVASAPDPARGNLVAALTGLTWALTIAGLRWTGRGGPDSNAATSSVVLGNVFACLASLPMALPVAGASWADLAVVGYLGFFQVGLAYLCLTRAIRRVSAFEATTVLLLEPALNPFWAWLVQGERPGAGSLAGGALILAATFANTWYQSRGRLAA